MTSADLNAPASPTRPPCKVVDASGLTCPLPLLRLKVALRELAAGDTVQLITTDPNSGRDIARFCEVGRHQLQQTTLAGTSHFLITKAATV